MPSPQKRLVTHSDPGPAVSPQRKQRKQTVARILGKKTHFFQKTEHFLVTLSAELDCILFLSIVFWTDGFIV